MVRSHTGIQHLKLTPAQLKCKTQHSPTLCQHRGCLQEVLHCRCCMQPNFSQACKSRRCCNCIPVSILDLLLDHNLAHSALAICLQNSYMLYKLSSWSDVQTLHNEQFLLVVKSTPPQHGETATAGIAAVPAMSETTLILVSNILLAVHPASLHCYQRSSRCTCLMNWSCVK